jgi:hypothetical protein
MSTDNKTITVTTIDRHSNKKMQVIILINKIISLSDNPQGGQNLPTKIQLVEDKKIYACETKEEIQKMLD